MPDWLWTLLLVGVSCTGLWLAPRSWKGWAITTSSEALWAAYAIHLHAPSLLIMSAVWFVLNGRAMLVTRKAQCNGN